MNNYAQNWIRLGSLGPDRLRDRQHCRGQGEPGDVIGHFDSGNAGRATAA